MRVSLQSPRPIAGSLINLETGELYEGIAWDGQLNIEARPAPGRYVVRASLAAGTAPEPIAVGVLLGIASSEASPWLLRWAVVGPIALLIAHYLWYHANGSTVLIAPTPGAPAGRPHAS